MLDPVLTPLVLTATKWISDNLLTSGAAAAVLTNIASNQFDPVFNRLRGAMVHSLADGSLPKNHDVERAVRAAQLSAAKVIVATFAERAHRRNKPTEIAFAAQTLAWLRRQAKSARTLTVADVVLARAIEALSAPFVTNDPRLSEASTIAAAATLEELILGAGGNAPAGFETLFLAGDDNCPSWFAAFGAFVAAEIKETPRFRSVVLAANVAEVGAGVRRIEDLLREQGPIWRDLRATTRGLLAGIKRLEAGVKEVGAGVDRIERDTQRIAVGVSALDKKIDHVTRILHEQKGPGKGSREPRPTLDASAQEQADPRLKSYLTGLVRKFRHLPLLGFKDEPDLEIALEKVYVALQAVDFDFELRRRLHAVEVQDRMGGIASGTLSAAEREGYDARVIREGFRSRADGLSLRPLHSAGQLFRDHRRLVILGGPGSGKSTLGQWIALQCARALLEEIETGRPAKARSPRDQIEFEPTTDPHDMVELGPARLPIFLKVADYASELARRKDAGEPAISLLHYVGMDQGSAEFDPDLAADERNALFQDMIRSGRGVMILDGLDELVEGTRLALLPKIHEFINEHVVATPLPPHQVGGNQILITSRFVGYELTQVRADCTHFAILPMPRTAVERFARSWGEAVNAVLSRAGDRLFDAEGLIGQIFDSGRPRIRELAETPLLVTVLAAVFYRDGGLPDYRTQVYRRLIDNMLDVWLQRPQCEGLKREELLAALEPLAADLQQNASRNGLIVEEDLARLMSPALAHMRRVDDPNDRRFSETRDGLLDAITKHVGLLAERGRGVYAFFHRTIQEYLAAQHLLRDPSRAAAEIRSRLDDPLWREPLLFALEHAMLDPHRNPEDRASLLADILSADDGDVLIPSASLIVAAALAQAPSVPAAAIEQAVDRLLASFERCLGSKDGSRLGATILEALSKLRNGSHGQIVDGQMLSSLRNGRHANAVAVLFGRYGRSDSEAVEATLDALPADRPELGWPLHWYVLDILSDEGSRLSVGDQRRLARRAPMRARFIGDPELRARVTADPDWLWLVLALYGGIAPQEASGAESSNLDSRDGGRESDGAWLLFNPHAIIDDVRNVRLNKLIREALDARRPALSLLPTLEAMWLQDDPDCDGEVVVAMAALGCDVVPLLRNVVDGPGRTLRVAAALRRFAWLAHWVQSALHVSGDAALRTLPAAASERHQLDLLRTAVDVLLSAGVAPASLARSPWDGFVATATAAGSEAVKAERWACAMLGDVDAELFESLLDRSEDRKDILNVWARLPDTGAVRSRIGRKWSLPRLMPMRPEDDHYEYVLTVLAARPPGDSDFSAGRVLGLCFDPAHSDELTCFLTARLLAIRGPAFSAGFCSAGKGVQITEAALAGLDLCLGPEATAPLAGLKDVSFHAGEAFSEEAERALGRDAWLKFGHTVLFWIAPGVLHRTSLWLEEWPAQEEVVRFAEALVFGEPDHPDRDGIDRASFRPLMRSGSGDGPERHGNPFFASASSIAKAYKATGQATWDDEVVDFMRPVLAWREPSTTDGLPIGEGTPVDPSPADLKAMGGEEALSDLIRGARLQWRHDAQVLVRLDEIAGQIEDPWLRNGAMDRRWRLIVAHRNTFMQSPLAWRLRSGSRNEVVFRAGHMSGPLVWGLIYFATLIRELGDLDTSSADAEQAWSRLSGPASAEAVKSLLEIGELGGLRVGKTEALIMDRVVQQCREHELEELLPLLEATAEAQEIVDRWATGEGAVSDWARLTQAEAGLLRPSTVQSAIRLLDHPADRLRLRASLALHGRQPHFRNLPFHSRRWSVRAEGVAEALNLVALEACAPEASEARRTILQLIPYDVHHNDRRAVEKWIAEARHAAPSSPSHWILRSVLQADADVFDAMIEGMLDAPASLQESLLEGLCRGLYRSPKVRPDGLERISQVPFSVRKRVAFVPDGATEALRAVIAAQKEPKAQQVATARKLFSQRLVWLDEGVFSETDKIHQRLAAIGDASIIPFDRYWLLAIKVAEPIPDKLEAAMTLLSWLRAEMAESANPGTISHILSAIEAVATAAGEDNPLVDTAADPKYWEPVLVEWAQFLPWWLGRMAAVSLLGRLRRLTPKIVRALVSAIKDDAYVQLAAFEAGGRFRSVDGDILPNVLPLLNSTSTSVAAAAAGLLTAISRGDGEFVDRRLIFRALDAAANRGARGSVYLQDDHTDSPMGFHNEGRLDRILQDAALSVGGF